MATLRTQASSTRRLFTFDSATRFEVSNQHRDTLDNIVSTRVGQGFADSQGILHVQLHLLPLNGTLHISRSAELRVHGAAVRRFTYQEGASFGAFSVRHDVAAGFVSHAVGVAWVDQEGDMNVYLNALPLEPNLEIRGLLEEVTVRGRRKA